MKLLPDAMLVSMKFLRMKPEAAKNLNISSTDDILYLPLYDNFQELEKGFSGLFGKKASRKLFPRIFFSKKTQYVNPFIAGNREVVVNTIQSVDEKFKTKMDYDANPISILVGKKNVLVDTTDIFPRIIPEKYSDMKAIYENGITLYPELLYWFLYGFSKKGEEQFAHFTRKLFWTGTPLSSSIHQAIIVPIEVKTSDKRIANVFMHPENKVSDFVLRDLEVAKVLSISRILCQIFTQETDSEESKLFADGIGKDKRLYFFFHNKNYGFFVHLPTLREKKVLAENFLSLFKSRLRSLLSVDGTAEDLPNKDDFVEDESEQQTLSDIEKEDPVGDDKKEVLATVTNLRNRKIAQRSEDLLADLKDSLSSKPVSSVSIRKEKNKRVKDSDEDALLEFGKQLSAPDEEGIPDEIPDVPETPNAVEKTSLGKSDGGLPAVEEETAVGDGENVVETDHGDLESLLREVERERRPKKSVGQMRRIEKAREMYKSITLGDKTVEEILASPVLDIDVLPSKAAVRDQSVKFFTTMDMDRSYVTKTFEYDILKIAKSFSENKSINLHMIDLQKEDTSDQFNEKITYRIVFEDENQKRHTVRFDMPKIDGNGFLKINGNVKILKKQLIPIPILKIKPDSVSVSSNYNKVLVERQGSTLNRDTVVLKRLVSAIESGNKGIQVFWGNNVENNAKYPTNLEYDEMAKVYHRIVISPSPGKKVVFYFNQDELRELAKGLKFAWKPDTLPIGIDYGKRELIAIGLNSGGQVAKTIADAIVSSGTIPDASSIVANTSSPKKRTYSRIMIQSKTVPLIVFLGALFGLKKILEAKKVEVDFVEKRISGDTRPSIRFADGFLYYPEYPIGTSLLINGLADMDTESMALEDLETALPYIEYCYDSFKTRNLLKGWVAFKELFLDPITLEVLANYNLPTDFLEVFMYANDLLEDNAKESEIMRVRGFETLNAILYNALARNYVVFKQKVNPKNQTFNIPQSEILDKLHKSFIMENYDTINPVNEMKMRSVVTYKGPQGINTAEAFTLDKRAYDPSMVGIIGMSSVDSDQVGIVKTMTINPRITSTRGYFDSLDDLSHASELSLGNLATPEEAMIPFLNKHDDPKRQGFASNQTKHVIGVKGSEIPLIGTGVEQAMAYKLGDTYAFKAKDDGVVVEFDETDHYFVVQYKSGVKERVDYGMTLNRNSSFFLTNNLTPDVKLGSKFRNGDILTHNEEFIRKRGGRFYVVQGTLARVAILDEDSTEEDSSDIGETLARKMAKDVVNRKQIGLGRLSNVISWKNVGDDIKSGDVFMVFENATEEEETTASLLDHIGPIDEETLSELTRHRPVSKYTGKIIDMKVYWSIPLEQMSPSLRKFVKAYIVKLQAEVDKEEKSTGRPSSLRRYLEIAEPIRDRINGVEVAQDGGVVIEYFVAKEHMMNVGDKCTYYSSLKSIIAHVWPKELEPYTESGDRIDATMGFISAEARMVLSPYMAGYLGKVIDTVGKRIAKEYLDIK